jgi:hypothetical protein
LAADAVSVPVDTFTVLIAAVAKTLPCSDVVDTNVVLKALPIAFLVVIILVESTFAFRVLVLVTAVPRDAVEIWLARSVSRFSV